MIELIVTDCGPMTTLQDLGRFGYQKFGVSPAGAMDVRALGVANALVGKPLFQAAIEFMNLGGAFTCRGGDLRMAGGGAGCTLSVEGRSIPPQTTAIIRDGEVAQV